MILWRSPLLVLVGILYATLEKRPSTKRSGKETEQEELGEKRGVRIFIFEEFRLKNLKMLEPSTVAPLR